MKTHKKHLKIVALFFSVLIFFQGCTVYKSANVTLEEAVMLKTNVKITTKNNSIYQFERLKFEEGLYYGYSKVDLKTSGKYKVHVIEENVEKTQIKDGKKSNTNTAISYGILGAAVLGVLIGVVAKKVENTCLLCD